MSEHSRTIHKTAGQMIYVSGWSTSKEFAVWWTPMKPNREVVATVKTRSKNYFYFL